MEVLFLFLCVAAPAGCTTSAPVQTRLRDNDRIIYIQGTTGRVYFADRYFREALEEAGCSAEVVADDWHHAYKRPFLFVVANRREFEFVVLAAQDLADDMIAFKRDDASGRLYLVAYSAGSVVVRQALELLPPDVKVENVILMIPANAPGAPFERALRAVEGKIYCIHSFLDITISGAGVLLGTSDRHYAPAAGMVGLQPSKELDDETWAYWHRKVVNVPWKPDFARWGFMGDHFSGWNPAFVREVMLPMLDGRYHSENVVVAREID